MKSSGMSRHSLMSAMLMATTATAAWAQGRQDCTGGERGEISYGISSIECLQCTIHMSGDERWIEYGAEPVIRSVASDAGPIHGGDVLVAIDGQLITTASGGRRLANPEAGRLARFSIRRGGRQVEVTVAPVTSCAATNGVSGQADFGFFEPTPGATRGGAGRRMHLSLTLDSNGHYHFMPNIMPRHFSTTLHFERDSMNHFHVLAFDSLFLNGFGRGGRNPISSDEGIRRDVGGARGARIGGGSDDAIGRGAGIGRGRGIGRGADDATAHGMGIGHGQDSLGGTADVMDVETTRGWLGLALDCLRCSVDRVDRTSSDKTLRFTTPPRVVAVESGSAASQAGFVRGDVIRTIDGRAMTSAAGARRFSTMKGNERVRFIVERGQQLVVLTMVVPPVK